MKLRSEFFHLLLIGMFALSAPAMALYNVWSPEDGVEIRQADHMLWTKEGVAQRDDGSYAVVWSSAEEQTQNVYLQEIDPSGNPVWPEEGLQITSDPWAQDDAIVMPWNDGGWIVAWRDYRNGTDKGHPGEMYLQRVTPDGSLLWNSSGLFSGSEEWTPRNRRLFPAGDNHFLAIWWGYGNTSLQLFDANGIPQFNDPLLVSDENCVDVISDGTGGVFVFINPFNQLPLIAHHILPDGSRPWGPDGIVVIADPGDDNPTYEIVTDGLGGAFITWSFYGYDGLNDIYGQHMDSQGNTLWTDPITVLAGGVGWQNNTEITPGEPGNFYMVYNEGQNGYDPNTILVQQVSSVDGSAELAWGENLRGVELASGDYIYAHYSSLIPDGTGGAAVTWTENLNELNPAFLAHVTSGGGINWSTGPVHGYAMMCSGLTLIMRSEEVILFSHENKPYQSTVTADYYSFATGDLITELMIAEGFDGDIEAPRIVRSGDNAYISWSDRRLMSQGALPYLQMVDVLTGEPQWEQHGINIVPGFNDPMYAESRFVNYQTEVIDDGFGNAIVGWHMAINDSLNFFDYHGRLQKVTPEGELLWGDEGIAIEAASGYDLTVGKMFTDGQGGANFILSSSGDLYLQHVYADGQLQWDNEGLLLIEDDYTIYLKDVIELGDGSMILLFYRLLDTYHGALFALRVNSSAEPLWPEPLMVLDLESPHHTVRHFDAVRVGDRIVVGVLAADNSGGHRVIRIQVIDQNGESLWPGDPLELGDVGVFTHAFSFAPAGDYQFWMIWRAGDLMLNRFDHNKQSAFDESIVLGGVDPIKVVPLLVEDNERGVFAFWTSGELWQDTKLKFTHITFNGSLAQPEYSLDGVYLNDTVHEKGEQYAVSDGEGGVLTVWNDYRGRIGELEGDDVYAMRINEAVTAIADNQLPLQGGWKLEPVCPNPFNASTLISYAMPERAQVKVAVYDLLGREVLTLVNQVKAAGEHDVVFNSTGLASGVYFVRATVPGKLDASRKITLLK